jgi:hypothetical protein
LSDENTAASDLEQKFRGFVGNLKNCPFSKKYFSGFRKKVKNAPGGRFCWSTRRAPTR